MKARERAKDEGRRTIYQPGDPARRRSALGLALIMGIGLIAETPVHGDVEGVAPDGLTTRLNTLRHEQTETRDRIRETARVQGDVIGELRAIQDSLARTARQIADGQKRLDRVNTDLGAARVRLEESRKKLGEDRERMARRIVAARRTGESGYLAVALGARDFNDFLRREAFVERIVRSDVELIRSMREQVERIRAEEARIEGQQAILQGIAASLAEQREAQRREFARQTAVYERLRHQRAELEVVYARLEQDSENVRALLVQRSQAAAQLSEISAQHTPFPAQPSGMPVPLPVAEPLPIVIPEGEAPAETWDGGFLRPVSGRVTSRFGQRFHPVLHVWKLHTGVDFSAPTGTPIHAAAAGTVVHSGWLGAYGYAVVLDHGGGVSTLYGHCSALDVVVGQDVAAGEVIARSGSTGYSTGPHLHFEKRVNGSPVPPF